MANETPIQPQELTFLLSGYLYYFSAKLAHRKLTELDQSLVTIESTESAEVQAGLKKAEADSVEGQHAETQAMSVEQLAKEQEKALKDALGDEVLENDSEVASAEVAKLLSEP